MSNAAFTTDLATSAQTSLLSLPPELLHIIISYLFPTHNPTRLVDSPQSRLRSHPLLNLCLTNKALASEVELWSAHQFPVWTREQQGGAKPHRNSNAGATGKGNRSSKHCRAFTALMLWSKRRCVFCGRTSQRSAVLMNGLRCCVRCDRAHFNLRTRSAARVEYNLRDAHLLGDQPDNVENSNGNKTKIPAATVTSTVVRHSYPPLRFGMCWSAGVKATMFAVADLEKRAALVHGPDWRGHLQRREARRVARRQAMEIKRATQAAE